MRGREAPGPIPVGGRDFARSRVYPRASDYVKHGFTRQRDGTLEARSTTANCMRLRLTPR